MIKTKFDRHSGILESRFEGQITVDEIVDYIIATKKNQLYPRVLKILTNATTALMNFSPAALTRIVEENYKSLVQYEYIIDAIVIDSPRATAMTILYQELAKTNKYRFEIFSTRESAQLWLEDQ